ncbi:M56 family metallopeptidase [Anaerosporobacter sp.]|uniref:M56 family metallopeptidase n=1 Tax=Anaerosporobacter sp. TaxID=1872529 RepID=UPI00286F0F56|nr:M56 family metallopeptidase [Anaerosporobacter sp.]
MGDIFIRLLNLSISTTWLIVVVLILRILLHKAPKSIHRFLWLLVGIRLILPFSIESVWSLIPSAEPIKVEMTSLPEEVQSNVLDNGYSLNPEQVIENDTVFIESKNNSNDTKQIIVFVISIIWLGGVAVMLFYCLISVIVMKAKVKTAVYMRDNIWQCDNVQTPFILGVFKPQIYIPFHIKNQELKYIVAHENMHLKHLDHLIKPIAFLILSVYWFNPLIWLAYIMLCRDIELACDERVIGKMDSMDKKEYSETLLSCSISRRSIAACPLAFGEVGVKARIKSILNYKKPKFWIVILAIIVCGIVGVCFLTNPKSKQEEVNLIDDKISAIAANMEEVFAFVSAWGEAFVNKNAEYIVSHTTKEVQKELEQKDLLTIGSDYYSFGYSSPWPMEIEQGFHIETLDEDYAEIIYYAMTSDPHVTAWREKIQFNCEDGSFVVTNSELIYLDNICTPKELTLANPEGVITRMMDYQTNGLGEVLNQNALSSSSSHYEDLFQPETAAINLLNLSNDPDKVKVTVSYMNETSTVAQIVITFVEENVDTEVTMIKAFGKDGIWIPKTRSNNDDASEYTLNDTEGEEIDVETRDEYGFYTYLPMSAYGSDYEYYKEELGEDFLAEYYKLVTTEEADISESSGLEKIEVYAGNIGDGDSGYVLFKDASGNILHTEFAHSARAGWNNVYVGSVDGMDFILNYYNEDRDTYGGYGFCVYRLDDKGEMEYLVAKGMDFGSQYIFNDEKFKEWEEELSYYMSNSHLVLSTQEGELKTGDMWQSKKHDE